MSGAVLVFWRARLIDQGYVKDIPLTYSVPCLSPEARAIKKARQAMGQGWTGIKGIVEIEHF